MFNEESFDVFLIPGLENRMHAIRRDIQPIFQELNEWFKEKLAPSIESDLYIHIAQHIRRSVYPPENTWSAISRQKRGYKMEAHFQLGIFPEYVFVWLSLIDQPKGKDQMAEIMRETPQLWQNLPKEFSFNTDHTKDTYHPFEREAFEQSIARLTKVKKSELQVGRVFLKTETDWQNKEQIREEMLATYQALLPLYVALM